MSEAPVFSPLTIRIGALQAETILGAYAQEKKCARPIQIHLTLTLAQDDCTASDSIHDTVDYDHITQAVLDYVATHSHDLIETLVQRLLERVLAFPLVAEATIEIEKPGAVKHAGLISVLRTGRKMIYRP